jgi:DNA polymerase elongation subunit (family B)
MKVFLDVECYCNYFLICFKSTSGKNRSYQITDTSSLNFNEITDIMRKYLTIGFNSKSYDLPMISYALSGATRQQLKEFSDQIITSGKFSWEVCREYNIKVPYFWNHIDLIEVAPAIHISLKMYGARMHSKILQDLPYEPDKLINSNEHEVIKNYCFNDINITIELYDEIQDRIELREKIGKIYNLELRSKSDAQVAEAIIKNLLLIKHYDNVVDQEKVYAYTPPSYINFITEELLEFFSILQKVEFRCNEKGALIKDKKLKSKVTINNVSFSLGIGGLHSNEKHVATLINEDEFLLDVDVVSYYPSIILNNGYYPEKLGINFLTLYRTFYNERIRAKKNNDKIRADTYKIILNGSFGKFGSRYSALYSPNLLLHTTITGQLSLLMLIENLSLQGFEIISANTDGVTVKGKKDNIGILDTVLNNWEETTNLKLEKTHYKTIYHESVNSYIAILEDNSVKCKGFYALEGLVKNPVSTICIEAIIEYLQNRIDIEDTIFNNKDDIRKFLIIRRVEGGGVFRDKYLGKTVRWYYSKDGDKITYKKNGNKVAGSDGAIPLMILDDKPRADIDFQKYIDKSYEMLKNLGVK